MRHRNQVFTVWKTIRYFIYILIITFVSLGSLVALASVRIMQEADEIDPTIINRDLNETSMIYDQSGKLIEKVETPEYRTMIGIQDMPKSLKDAFISIEDERFIEHIGIDPKGILASIRDNFLSGSMRGGSTITQQLVKNTFLDPTQRTLKRKLTEATMAIELEKMLSKDQILEAYLNRVSMGQNAYGVEEAAQTYFSKHSKDLSIVESAMLASVVKSPNSYPPFYRVKPSNFNPDTMYKVGTIDLLGESYVLVYNNKNGERASIVLKKMYELGKITKEEYEEAKRVDMKTILNPGRKKQTDITNYFADYVKESVTNDLMDKYGWTQSRAQDMLFYGGIKIYSTIDIKIQKEVEDAYKNFVNILVGNVNNLKAPILLDMQKDQYGNIIDSRGQYIFLRKDNIISQDNRIYLAPDEFKFADNGDLLLKSVKLLAYPSNIDILDYYTIDEEKNLLTHTIGSLPIQKDDFTLENGFVRVKKASLDALPGLYEIIDDYLYFSPEQIYVNRNGVVQPQSSTIIIDYHNGHILAMSGGRDVDGNRIFNRATNSERQPGSAIKPVGVYLEALDNGFTAASAIDDIPLKLSGKLWPNNWYSGYRGIHTLRYAVEQSINTSAVHVLNAVGINKVIPYLEKMGIIDREHPDRDTFVTREENKSYNDENPSALALGGMTKGMSPLTLAGAYTTIANGGNYIKPTAYTKVVDRDGNTLLEYDGKTEQVVSEQTAYIMKDILRSVVTNGLGGSAKIQGQAVAGKTGTTQNTADLWFVGFTNYYLGATWIGSDTPRITMNKNSMIAAQLWQYIMAKAHEDLESKPHFEQPEGIVKRTFCSQSGKIPSELCSKDPRGTIRSDIFVKGTEPTAVCDVHVEATICTESDKLATEFCPEDTKETRVFIKRTPLYDPSEYGGIIPSDFEYQIPTESCDIHDSSTVTDDPEDPAEHPDDDNPNINIFDPDNTTTDINQPDPDAPFDGDKKPDDKKPDLIEPKEPQEPPTPPPGGIDIFE